MNGEPNDRQAVDARKKVIGFAVAIIALGVAWLLDAAGWWPSVEWVWPLGLATMGILAVAIGGLDKVTAVIGPFLIIGAGFSIARQMGRISVHYEAPILFIIFGVLLLISGLAKFKPPDWL